MKQLINQSLDELCINTIRMLSIDAVQKADSGHPGFAAWRRTYGLCFMDTFS